MGRRLVPGDFKLSENLSSQGEEASLYLFQKYGDVSGWAWLIRSAFWHLSFINLLISSHLSPSLSLPGVSRRG